MTILKEKILDWDKEPPLGYYWDMSEGPLSPTPLTSNKLRLCTGEGIRPALPVGFPQDPLGEDQL